MYVTESNDDVQILNCVTGADAANLKFTGGNYRLQNLVILDSPMAFIYAAQGNSLASWPGGSSFKCDNLLQIGSDDQQTAPLEFAYRGWLPHIYSFTAGSFLKNALMLNATDANGTNRQAVVCSSNGSGTATALLMDNTVTANWAVQDTTVNPDASTTVTFTNNIWQAPSSGSNLITTATPAAYQTKLANALTLTAGNSLRLAYPAYFSTVVVGANVRATTLNMLEFMGKNTIPDGVGGVPNPWCSLAQTHFRSALA